MRKGLFNFVFLLSIIGYSQYANLELSTGGFSLVPAFTDTDPNLIFQAGSSDKRRISTHLIGNIKLATFNPRVLIFMTRAKLIDKEDKKFKLSAGVHLPVLQIDEKYNVLSFFAQELVSSYPLSKKILLHSTYIHGKGRNNDLEINLFTLSGIVMHNRFRFASQVYYLDLDQTYGIAETISYNLNSRLELRTFVNQTLSTNQFIWTAGLNCKL